MIDQNRTLSLWKITTQDIFRHLQRNHVLTQVKYQSLLEHTAAKSACSGA